MDLVLTIQDLLGFLGAIVEVEKSSTAPFLILLLADGVRLGGDIDSAQGSGVDDSGHSSSDWDDMDRGAMNAL